MTTADLIVIGAGPGGYDVAAARARAGERVILIDYAFPGGTCLNRGCIPTKCLAASSEAAIQARNAAALGVSVGEVMIDYTAVVHRMESVVEGLRDGVRALIAPCTFVYGQARILPDGTVGVGDQVFTAPKVLIATGSAPAALNIPGAGLTINSDGVLQLEELPRSMAIIGAGVIGMEFASIMNGFGVEVTVIEYLKEVLPPFDKEISKRLRTMLTRRGVKFVLGAAVTAVTADNEGVRTVSYDGKKGPETLQADTVVMAVGRRPVVPEGLAEAGIETDRRGYIVTDARMRTTRPGFYAVGDCNGRLQLAHAATAQARVALGEDVNLDAIPAAIFTCPEAAMVGLTTEQAQAQGVNFRTAKALYSANGKAQASGQADGLVKVLYAPDTRRLLGCHIVGAHASDLIAEAALAVSLGLSLDALTTITVHSHPSLSELIASFR